MPSNEHQHGLLDQTCYIYINKKLLHHPFIIPSCCFPQPSVYLSGLSAETSSWPEDNWSVWQPVLKFNKPSVRQIKHFSAFVIGRAYLVELKRSSSLLKPEPGGGSWRHRATGPWVRAEGSREKKKADKITPEIKLFYFQNLSVAFVTLLKEDAGESWGILMVSSDFIGIKWRFCNVWQVLSQWDISWVLENHIFPAVCLLSPPTAP